MDYGIIRRRRRCKNEWVQSFGVLASGVWDDNYLWIDAENWNDDQPSVLATGAWNGRGMWSDAVTWNDGV